MPVPAPSLARASALALLLVGGVACDRCGDDGPGATAESPVREPVPPPEGLAWELSIGGGAEAMRAMNARLPPGRARLLVPETPGELVDRMLSGIELGGRVADDASFHALGLRLSDGVWNVSAVRVTLDPTPTPLGEGVPLHPGAPAEGRFVGSVPDDEDVAAVLVDDVLVFGERRAAVERAMEYLAFTRVPADVPDGISLRTAPDVARDVRAVLDQLVRRTAGDMRSAAVEARGEHDTPPDFGDPETLVAVVEESLTGWIALLPDVGELRASLEPGDEGLTLDAELDVRDGSPLAEILARTPTGDAAALEALPDGTSLAWLVRSVRHEAASSFVADIARVAGDRLTAPDRAALDALAASLAALSGDARVVALGGIDDGAFALYGVASPAVPFDRETLRAAASRPFVASVLGRAFGCAPPRAFAFRGDLTERTLGADDDATIHTSSFPICGDRFVFVREGAGTLSIGAGRGIVRRAEPESHPDVARAVRALGGELVFALVFVPSRVAAAAPLVEIGPLQAIAARLDAAERDAPIALGISKREGGLALRVVVTTSAIEDALTLASAFE
jgi:hypothetical protein